MKGAIEPMLLDFTIYLTVRSVEQLDLGGKPAVLVKATSQPKGDVPWRAAMLVCSLFARLATHRPLEIRSR